MKRMVEEYGLIVVVICLLFLMLAFFYGDFNSNIKRYKHVLYVCMV